MFRSYRTFIDLLLYCLGAVYVAVNKTDNSLNLISWSLHSSLVIQTVTKQIRKMSGSDDFYIEN